MPSSPSKSAKNKSNPVITWIKKNPYITIGIVLVAVVVYDLSPFGGNIRFYSKWAECGQKPVAENLEWRFGGNSPESYEIPPNFSLMRKALGYYCTPLAAEEAGYSASPYQYEFPHLRKARGITD